MNWICSGLQVTGSDEDDSITRGIRIASHENSNVNSMTVQFGAYSQPDTYENYASIDASRIVSSGRYES